MGLVAHLWCDEAAAISFTAFFAQAEDICIDPSVDRPILVQESGHLVLARGAPCRVSKIAVCGARYDLGLV